MSRIRNIVQITACLAFGLVLLVPASALAHPPEAGGHAHTAPQPAAVTPVEAPTLDGLLKGLAALPGLEVQFREEKFISLLSTPIVSEGVLHYAPPGRLARHITKPAPSTVLIDGDSLRFGDAKGAKTIDLAANPVVRLFVESFVKLLAGDKVALEHIYTMTFKAKAAGAWRLTLMPKIAPMNTVISKMVVTGTGLEIATMTLLETVGDETVTTFETANLKRRYTATELKTIFRLPGER